MTYQQIFALAKKEYGLKKIVWLKKNVWYFGSCQCRLGIIRINKKIWNQYPTHRRSLIFHELGHMYCYNNGIYKNYHYKEDNQKVIRTGLKAERWVDRWAAKELKKYFPKERYKTGYTAKKSVDDYRKNYLSLFR